MSRIGDWLMLFFLPCFLSPTNQVENVRLLDRVCPRRSKVGTLYLTATHTIFVENEVGVRNESWVGINTLKDSHQHNKGY